MLPKLELTLAKGILEVLWFAISKINCILLVLFHKDTSAIKMDILVSMWMYCRSMIGWKLVSYQLHYGENRHQHILSPTSITNLDVTLETDNIAWIGF